MKQPSIFISYRRSDTAGHAGRVYDRLKQWFATEELFYDLQHIEAGSMFPQQLHLAIKSAKVVLVLIGPDWIEQINQRAVHGSHDVVRAEVALALQLQQVAGVPAVIPVLLGESSALRPTDLHASLRYELQSLCCLDAHEFCGKNADWDEQFVRLRGLIAKEAGVPAPRYRPPADAAKPFRVIDHLLSPHFRDPGAMLGTVRKLLLAESSAAVVVPAALYGMGGVGKTQLALKYTYEYRDCYAGVWWFRAESENTLQLDARDACIHSNVVVADGETPTVALKRWMQGQELAWLLVFDNAESVAQLRPHLPQGGPHHVLITSRDPAWGGVARTIELSGWSDDDGADFLAARLAHDQRHELSQLSRSLGGLQLALEQAAAFLEQTGGSITSYRAQLEGVDTSAPALDEGLASTGYQRSVLATLSLAFPRLSTPAQQLLRLCAFFSAEPIPERYFRAGESLLDEGLAAVVAKPLAWERTVAELRRFGIAARIDMLTLDVGDAALAESVEKALVLHRLTLEVARHSLSVPADDGPRVQNLLHAQCPAESNEPRWWPHYTALLPHLLKIDWLQQQPWLDRRIHAWMLDNAAGYLRNGKALYQAAERMCRAALALNRVHLGDDHPQTLLCMNNLAETLRDRGDLDAARSLHEQVLAMRRRALGEEHPGTLTSMSNLAYTLWAQGDWAAALNLGLQSLTVRRRVLGAEHPHTLVSMNNVGLALRVQGDLGAARQLQEDALAISRQVLGEQHPDTLMLLNNLALTLRAQGDLSGARELLEGTVTMRRQVLGEEHPDTLMSSNNLAGTMAAQDDLEGAHRLQEQVLAVRRRVLGQDHPDTLTSMNNLAHTLWAQGELDKACDYEEIVLAARRRVLGEEHPDTLTSLNNLAHTLWQQGAHDRAITYMAAAAAGRSSRLTPEHRDTWASRHTLAAWRAVRNKAGITPSQPHRRWSLIRLRSLMSRWLGRARGGA